MAFAGLKFADAGSFDYGRNYGVIYDVTSWTDVLPEFGGDTYGADNFLQSRANGVATYRNQDFFGLVDGLNFALQYQGKNGSVSGENDTGRSLLKQNGDGYGASVTYNLGEGFSIGGAMSSSKRTADQNNTANLALKGEGDRAEVYSGGLKYDANNIYDGISAGFAYSNSKRLGDQNSKLALGRGDNAETYTGGLKYDANNIYLATQYTQTYNATRAGSLGFANKAQNFEVVAQYQFDFGLRPSVAYLQSKGKDIEGYGDQDLLKYVDVGATYYFNKNMSTYVDYKINLVDENEFTRQAGIGTDDIVALGLVYQF